MIASSLLVVVCRATSVLLALLPPNHEAAHFSLPGLLAPNAPARKVGSSLAADSALRLAAHCPDGRIPK
jgi:hypothetical protein